MKNLRSTLDWQRERVGDLGALDDDGFLTVTGRIKDVVLRGGVSIGPLEIDAAIMSPVDVNEAAAIGVPDPIWGEVIACYVVVTDGAQVSAADIIGHADHMLPNFKRPRFVECVDALPKSDRGKVRRADLKSIWAKIHTIANGGSPGQAFAGRRSGAETRPIPASIRTTPAARPTVNSSSKNATLNVRANTGTPRRPTVDTTVGR